jgi:hypothetical protein
LTNDSDIAKIELLAGLLAGILRPLALTARAIAISFDWGNRFYFPNNHFFTLVRYNKSKFNSIIFSYFLIFGAIKIFKFKKFKQIKHKSSLNTTTKSIQFFAKHSTIR